MTANMHNGNGASPEEAGPHGLVELQTSTATQKVQKFSAFDSHHAPDPELLAWAVWLASPPVHQVCNTTS